MSFSRSVRVTTAVGLLGITALSTTDAGAQQPASSVVVVPVTSPSAMVTSTGRPSASPSVGRLTPGDTSDPRATTAGSIPAIPGATVLRPDTVPGNARLSDTLTRAAMGLLPSPPPAGTHPAPVVAPQPPAPVVAVRDTSIPTIIVSLTKRRLWYVRGDSTLFTARVAVGTDKKLMADSLLQSPNGTKTWKFSSPKGMMHVIGKEENPLWLPPDWHYVEIATKKKLQVHWLARRDTVHLADGTIILVRDTNVVRIMQYGNVMTLNAGEGHEAIFGGVLYVPPAGTAQRKFTGVLGTRRLNLPDGFGIHGTDQPNSIGKAASHGCIRLKNADIEALYPMVPIGTPVYFVR